MRLSTFVLLIAASALLCAVAAGQAVKGSDAPKGLPPGLSGDQLAAPGYIDDASCAGCHAEIAQSYKSVGMANSFMKPTPDVVIEDFTRSTGFHEASQRHYEFKQENGEYKFRRYQTDGEGEVINNFEQKVDWILGSGAYSRTYLYQSEEGELFQLPIAYYTETKTWYMAPGYDRRDHEGVGRRVRRECMFCHNAYPVVEKGSDAYGTTHVFPKELPQGIGCQRCHGPGAEHVRLAQSGSADQKAVRGAIVHPGRLEPGLRDAVCDQCHLQPSVALSGIRRFGRSDYSYRAGEPLDDYLAILDVVGERPNVTDRFEINHHSTRLRQSRCFLESKGELSCATCHDPHRKVAPSERVEHYRAACLGCHQEDSFQPAHAAAQPPVASNDCAACHMSKRRTQDVVHVAVTDHRIQRTPGGEGLLAPLKESDPVISDVVFLNPAAEQGNELSDIYRAVAALRATSGSHAASVKALEELLPAKAPQAVEPYLDLSRGQIMQQRFQDANQTLQTVLKIDPDNLQAREWVGLTLVGLGRLDEAIEHFLQLLRDDPINPEAHYNLGLALMGKDEDQRALDHFQQAVTQRPNMAQAWFYVARANFNLDRLDEAIEAYRKTLSIEPSHTRAYLGVGEALIKANKPAEALRSYQHGLKVAARLAPIAEALDKLKSQQK